MVDMKLWLTVILIFIVLIIGQKIIGYPFLRYNDSLYCLFLCFSVFLIILYLVSAANLLVYRDFVMQIHPLNFLFISEEKMSLRPSFFSCIHNMTSCFLYQMYVWSFPRTPYKGAVLQQQQIAAGCPLKPNSVLTVPRVQSSASRIAPFPCQLSCSLLVCF